MRIFRSIHHPERAPACALTIGNFDGVHLGHQAMLAQMVAMARERGLAACVLTFEPHPRDYFAKVRQQPDVAPARIATLRDKLAQLEACGISQCVVMPFNAALSSLSPLDFVHQVLLNGLYARSVWVGDDFRYGAQRAGDHDTLLRSGHALGFEVVRMDSYELMHGPSQKRLRVSSSAVRHALAQGDMRQAAVLLGRAYAVSGHVVHGRKLGRELQCPTLNLRFGHAKPAASGIFVAMVHGLDAQPLPGVANFGVRPSLDANDVNQGQVLLETHCLDWPSHLGPEGGYGKLVRVELLHKLHDELKYDSLQALNQGIERDCEEARAWLASRI
ncbi:MAG: bifunctional riboflavin kinase/FAD synthetase [Limnohabitans sp.]